MIEDITFLNFTATIGILLLTWIARELSIIKTSLAVFERDKLEIYSTLREHGKMIRDLETHHRHNK